MNLGLVAAVLVGSLVVQAAIVAWPRTGIVPRRVASRTGSVPAPSSRIRDRVDRMRSRRAGRTVDPVRLALAAGCGALSIPIGLRLVDPAAIVYGGNDLGAHAGWTSEVSFLPPSIPQPHFGLHVLGRIAMVIGGTDRADLAVVAVVAVWVALGAWLLAGYLQRVAGPTVGRWWIVGATLLVVVGETPSAFLRRPSDVGGGTGYLALHQWATPTNAALLPVIVLLLPRLLRGIEGTLARRAGASLAAVIVVGMVAKPNAPLVLVPAALLLAVLAVRPLAAASTRVLGLVRWGALPLLVVGLWQAWFVSGLGPDRDGGFRLAPLHEMRIAGVLRPGAWLALVLPATLLVAAGGRWWRDRSVQIGLLAYGVGMAQFALLGETGYRRDHANWGISAYAGFLVLTVVAMGRGLTRFVGQDEDRPGPVARAATGAVVVVTVAAGLVAYVDSTGLG